VQGRIFITLNGERAETSASTLAGLLDELGITTGRVAVEHNLKVVKRDLLAEAALTEGDRVEVVNFVGGG
jgi:thiamine biosynthesis protein ThiS